MNTHKNKDEHYIHQTNYTQRERMVGLFIFFSFILFLFFIIISVTNEHLFEKRVTFYIHVNNSEGISQGATVKALGMKIGNVSSLNHSPEGKIKITLDVYEKQRALIKVGAKAVVNRLTSIGNASIEIQSDSGESPMLAIGSTIPVHKTASLNDLIFSIANIIQATNSKKLLGKVDTMLPKLEETMSNLHIIVEQISSGHGMVGAAVFDKGMEKDLKVAVKSGTHILIQSQKTLTVATQRLVELEALLKNTNQRVVQLDPLLKNTNGLVKDMQGISKNLPEVVKELRQIITQTNIALTLLNKELKDIPGVTTDVKRTLSKTNRLLDSVQNTWPLSDNIQKTKPPLLIAPHSNHE